MNDPHVVALHYNVVSGPGISFHNASPVSYECSEFSVKIVDGKAAFLFLSHFSSEQQAKNAIRSLLERWQMAAGLDHFPGCFKLEYERAEIIDRDPIAGVSSGITPARLKITGQAVATMLRTSYPVPPQTFEVSVAVQAMYHQYQELHNGTMPISFVAYNCLTWLEAEAGSTRNRRTAAAAQFAIDEAILDKVGHLTAEKGGLQARKARGYGREYSDQERHWLEEAVRAIIRRVGERAANPAASFKPITMADLPPL